MKKNINEKPVLQDLIKKDIYLFLRMGLRSDIHSKFYPNIPIIIPPKKIEQTKGLEILYGEDPYFEIRTNINPELQRKYYTK